MRQKEPLSRPSPLIAGRKREIDSSTKSGRNHGEHHINKIKAAAFEFVPQICEISRAGKLLKLL